MPTADKACGRVAFKPSTGPAPDPGFLNICACMYFLMGALTVRHESQRLLVNNIVTCSSKSFRRPSPELVSLTQEAFSSRATSKAAQAGSFVVFPKSLLGCLFDLFLPFPERPHCTPFRASSRNSAVSGSHRPTEWIVHTSRAHVQWDSIESLKSNTEGVIISQTLANTANKGIIVFQSLGC